MSTLFAGHLPVIIPYTAPNLIPIHPTHPLIVTQLYGGNRELIPIITLVRQRMLMRQTISPHKSQRQPPKNPHLWNQQTVRRSNHKELCYSTLLQFNNFFFPLHLRLFHETDHLHKLIIDFILSTTTKTNRLFLGLPSSSANAVSGWLMWCERKWEIYCQMLSI